MIKTRRSIFFLFALFIVSASLALAASFNVKTPKVYADEPPFQMVSGVSVRLSSNGLRYRVTMNRTTYDAIIADGDMVMGFFVFPTQLDDGTTNYASYPQKLDIRIDKSKIYCINPDLFSANGVIFNVKPSNRDLEYTAVGYSLKNGVYSYTSKNASKSLHRALSTVYFLEDRAEYREYFEVSYPWFGTASYPVIIDTSVNMDQYNILLDDVEGGETFEGVYFKITDDCCLPKGSPLLADGFLGRFTSDSARVYTVKDADVIEDFDDAFSCTRAFGGTGGTDTTVATSTWHSTYQGESGVVEIRFEDYFTGTWPWFTFLPTASVSSYANEGYTHIKLRMWVDSSKGYKYFVLANDLTNRSVCLNDNFVTEDAWEDYYFEIGPFTDFWDQAVAGDYGIARIWMNANNTSGGVIYISEITACNWTRPAPQSDEINFITAGAYRDITFKGQTSSNYVVSTAMLPAGATHGAGEYNIDSRWPIMYMNARQPVAVYSSPYTHVRLIMKFVSTQSTVELYFWEGSAEKITLPTNTWVTFTVSLEYFVLNYDTLNTVEKGWFWAQNDLGANPPLSQIYVYEARVVTMENPYHETGKFAAINENTTANFYSKTGDQATYIDTPTGNYPAVPSDCNGYMAIKNSSGGNWFDVFMKPTAFYEEFAQYDAIVLKLYAFGGASSINIYYYNHKFDVLQSNAWQEVYMPIALFNETEHTSMKFYTPLDFFVTAQRDKLLLFTYPGNSTICIADIKFVKDAVDNTLGDKYVHIDANNFTAKTGTVQSEIFDGRNVVKITSNDSWENIFVKPGKTYFELDNYNTLQVTLYLEGSSNIVFYNQGKFHGSTTNDIFDYGTATANAWTTLSIPISRVKEMWAGLRLEQNALMIAKGVPFTALYISDISCAVT